MKGVWNPRPNATALTSTYRHLAAVAENVRDSTYSNMVINANELKNLKLPSSAPKNLESGSLLPTYLGRQLKDALCPREWKPKSSSPNSRVFMVHRVYPKPCKPYRPESLTPQPGSSLVLADHISPACCNSPGEQTAFQPHPKGSLYMYGLYSAESVWVSNV